MSDDITETLRTMAHNIDVTRPEHDYSLMHRRIDDADIATLRRAANLLDDYRESFAAMARERDELWEDLERVTKERDEARSLVRTEQLRYLDEIERLRAERDEARREICSTVVFPSSPQEYAARRGWDCLEEVTP